MAQPRNRRRVPRAARLETLRQVRTSKSVFLSKTFSVCKWLAAIRLLLIPAWPVLAALATQRRNNVQAQLKDQRDTQQLVRRKLLRRKRNRLILAPDSHLRHCNILATRHSQTILGRSRARRRQVYRNQSLSRLSPLRVPRLSKARGLLHHPRYRKAG